MSNGCLIRLLLAASLTFLLATQAHIVLTNFIYFKGIPKGICAPLNVSNSSKGRSFWIENSLVSLCDSIYELELSDAVKHEYPGFHTGKPDLNVYI